MVTLDNLASQIQSLKQVFESAIATSKITPNQIATIRGLSDIDVNLGTIRAGEFLALSSGTDPQQDTTIGTFISAVGRVFGGKKYHIGGVNLGDLKWGVNSETGQLEAGDGAVALTENGLSVFSGGVEIARLGNITDFLPDITAHDDDVVYGFIIGEADTYMTYDSFRGLRIFGALQTNRETLTSNRTYYVSPSGSNSNDGSAAYPFLTIQYAIDYIANYLDTRQYNITISVADGEYAYSSIRLKNISGTGSVTIIGNTTTPASVYIKNTGYGFQADRISTAYTIQGMKIAAYIHFNSIFGSAIRISDIIFDEPLSGTCYAHMYAGWGGYIEILGEYTIGGSALFHMRALERGYIYYDGPATPLLAITISASLSIGVFASSAIQSSIYVPYLTFDLGDPPVTVTGKKYECNILSFIGTATAGANYFPGDSAGTEADYGVYD